MQRKAAQWLVHVDRQALSVWRDLLPTGMARVGAEAGEGFVPVRFETPVEAAIVRTGGLTRFVQPVALTFPLTACADGVAPELTAALAQLAAKGGAEAAWVYPVRRHGRFAAGRLTAWAKATLAGGASELASSSRAPRLMIAVGDDTAMAGVASPEEAGSPWPGGWPPGGEAPGPSRARAKLVEALALLEDWAAQAQQGAAAPQGAASQIVPPPLPWRRWLELGAFPGGMTAELARRGASVVAVDVAPPSAAMLALPGVTCVTADAGAYAPSAPFDALLCDVNGPPLVTAATVARLARELPRGGLLLYTLKLPRWDEYPDLWRLVEPQLAAAGVAGLRVRHLWHNRQEVTVFGTKA